MASRKLYCPACGAKIPSSARTDEEIICPNDNCMFIFSLDEIEEVKKPEKKPPVPRKNYLKIYLANLKSLRSKRLGRLKRSFLKRIGFLFLALLAVCFAAVFEYMLSLRGGWTSPFADYIPNEALTLLRPYADALQALIPARFALHFPLYYTVFIFCGYALIITCISLLFTRYTFYAAVRLMRFMLMECTVLYVYFILWPMAPALGPKFVCEDFIVFAFSHVWPALAVIVFLSIIKPAAAFFCARSDKYALSYKKSART